MSGMTQKPHMPHALKGRRYRLLLASLFVFLAYAGIRPQEWSGLILELLFYGVVLVAMWTIRRDRRTTIVAAILAILSLANPEITILPSNSMAHHVSAGLFLALLCAYILRDVLTHEEVTLETLAGSCCVYLMLGILWGHTYALIEVASPHSFSFTQAGAEDAVGVGVEMIYYSYVTLTTLGYGDMTPLSSSARIFSAMEALVGQLFVAVLIAHLVGMHAASKHTRKHV